MIMHRKNILKENMNVSESVAWELTTDAVIFRAQFEKYRNQYVAQSIEEDHSIIFAFIFLQVYVEYFLHQNMRRVVTLEFRNTDQKKYQKWMDNERNFIEDKISRSGKLSMFVQFFFHNSLQKISTLKKSIENNFKEITDIRDLLVHGHDISISGNIDSSKIEVSHTRALLTPEELEETTGKANKLGECWNKLLEEIFDQSQSLGQVDDFKFEQL